MSKHHGLNEVKHFDDDYYIVIYLNCYIPILSMKLLTSTKNCNSSINVG